MQATAAATRSLLHASARAQAAVAKGSALALLASDIAGRLALLQQAGGHDLAAKIDALMREQRQAEWALSVRLAAEEKVRRAGLRQAVKAQQPAGSVPERPREQSQGVQGRRLQR